MKEDQDPTEAAELCPVCGTAMVESDGQAYCPKCATEIDWGLEEDEKE